MQTGPDVENAFQYGFQLIRFDQGEQFTEFAHDQQLIAGFEIQLLAGGRRNDDLSARADDGQPVEFLIKHLLMRF